MTIIPLTDALLTRRNAAQDPVPPDDQALLDSYSQAVIDVVDRVAPQWCGWQSGTAIQRDQGSRAAAAVPE